MDIQNISNHFPFIYKPTQEIHDKQVPKYDFKVVDLCWISSTEWSDTFRSLFVYGKKQKSRKKCHNRAK